MAGSPACHRMTYRIIILAAEFENAKEFEVHFGGKGMAKISALAPLTIAWLLTGCATAAFDPPAYYHAASASDSTLVALDSTDVVQVTSYLRGATDTFDRMLKNSERLKHATELPIIGAAIFAPITLAIGNHTDQAIYAAGVGAAGGALSNYFGLRDREGAVALARGAVTCIEQRYSEQVSQARSLTYMFQLAFKPTAALGLADIQARANLYLTQNSTMLLATGLIGKAAPVAGDVASAGSIAVAGTNEVISRLKQHLAKMGQAPDYGAILKDLQAKQAAADAKKPAAAGFVESRSAADLMIASLADYPVHITECVDKFPA